MKLADVQFMSMFASLLHDHAEIISGAYKMRQVSHGSITKPGADFTDDEKLQWVLDAMGRKVAMLREFEDCAATD